MKTLKTWAAAAAIVTLSGASQAALVDRGGGMIYDSVQNITWLKNWDTNNGDMNWSTANAWAENLVYGGFSDWRLPTAHRADGRGECFVDPCTGIDSDGNLTRNEMGYLFYNYVGGKLGTLVTDPTGDTALEIANFALFTNLRADDFWSGSEYLADPGSDAWRFDMFLGRNGVESKFQTYHAVAVRPGDVAASAAAVPEPQSLALALLALGAVVATRRSTRWP